MVSPETEANSFTKAEKSIAVMPRAPHSSLVIRPSEDRRARQPLPACRAAGTVRRRTAGHCSVGSKAGFMSIQSGEQTAGAAAAVALVATLISVYIVSHFLRNSIGLIAHNFELELALSPVEIALLSSVFF